jgi:hypothetical protein
MTRDVHNCANGCITKTKQWCSVRETTVGVEFRTHMQHGYPKSSVDRVRHIKTTVFGFFILPDNFTYYSLDGKNIQSNQLDKSGLPL